MQNVGGRIAPSGPSMVQYACGYCTLQTGLFVAWRFLLAGPLIRSNARAALLDL
jgi:hypothetical protein